MNFMVMFYNAYKGEISYPIHFKTVEFSFSLIGKCSLKCQTKPFERPLGCRLYKYMANNEDYFCNNNNNKPDSPSTPIYPVSFTQNFCDVIKCSWSKSIFFVRISHVCAITHPPIAVP